MHAPRTIGWILFALAIGLVGPAVVTADEAAERAYMTANGLLNRGMYDLAAKEYRAFLDKYEDDARASVAHYGLAVCLYRTRDLPAAAEQLQQLSKVTDFEYAAEVLTMLGQCQVAAHDYEGAVRSLTGLLRRHGDHELADDGAALLVETLYRAAQHEQAVKLAAEFLRLFPGDTTLGQRVRFFLGSAQMALGEWRDARGTFERLLKDAPDSAFAPQATLALAQVLDNSGVLDDAVTWYRRALATDSAALAPVALWGLASIAYQQQKLDEAGELIDRFLSAHSDQELAAHARLLRGRVWFDRENYDKAAELFATLNDHDELVDDAAYWTGKIALRRGEFTRAAEILTRAADEHPDSELLPEFHYDIAVALSRTDDIDAAIAAVRTFRKQHADHALAPDALYLLATLEHRRAGYDDSAKHCAALLEKFADSPLTPDVLYLAAENEFLAGRYEESLSAYRRFLKTNASHALAPQARFRQALALYRLNQYEDARPLLIAILEADPQRAEFRAAHYALGDILFQRGLWADAEQHLAAYLKDAADEPGADDALLKLALCKQRQGRYADAIADHDRLLKRNADSPHARQARFERGQALLALERFDDAQKAFEAVIADKEDKRFHAYALNHLAAIAERRGDNAQAAQYLERVVSESEGDFAAEALFQRGRTLLASQDFASAESALHEFIGKFPRHEHHSEAELQLAIAIARQDRPADALQVITKLERSRAKDLTAAMRAALLEEKGWCFRRTDKPDEAIQTYRALLDQQAPEARSVLALLALAELEAQAGNCKQAIPALTQILQRDADGDQVPSDVRASARYRLGVCQFQSENFAAAVEALEAFLQHDVEHELARSAAYFCGEAHLKLGQARQAVPMFERVVEKGDDNELLAPALLRLGQALSEVQHWDRAERSFDRYLAKFPDAEFAYQAQFGLGWARENQQRYPEAITAYRVVVEKHDGPTAARAQFQIGECLFAAKQLDDAVRELLRVDILYSYPQWSAAALYEAGRCFEQLGKLVEARDQFRAVRERFADTKWAEMAAERLTAASDGARPTSGG